MHAETNYPGLYAGTGHHGEDDAQPTSYDPDANFRQDAYLRALQAHCPLVEIHFGHFLRHRIWSENANPPPPRVEIWKNEEKGSDVNLALHLLNDAYQNAYDCAVVVSNDSDPRRVDAAGEDTEQADRVGNAGKRRAPIDLLGVATARPLPDANPAMDVAAEPSARPDPGHQHHKTAPLVRHLLL